MAKRERITVDRLKELVTYDAESGQFRWNQDKGGLGKAGAVAGWLCHGYWRLCIDRGSYARSRLVWLYMTGRWPNGEIDHIDCNPLNDRFENIREATPSQNNANKRKYANNTSGFKGAYYHKPSGGLMSQIMVAGKLIYLGRFATAEEAHSAYIRAAERYNGDFARTA